MTALVSVMNKHAVVIAADSAITVTTPYGHKVIPQFGIRNSA